MNEEYGIGDLVVDTEHNKAGYVMGYEGAYVQLRIPGGGREWDARPELLRPPDEGEQLRASIVVHSLLSERCAACPSP
ncbi:MULTISPECIES: hypothetical protein [unclassified Streptomyces]|uniref:hypothetical protein n=1 Tax=unclassified Streptomyces TaxID=2593676 RepID=UPI00278C2D36|nr:MULTISPECIES: hypothetical protein [unclassified Streptomyces]